MLKAFYWFIFSVLIASSLPVNAEDNSAYKAVILFQTLKHLEWSTAKQNNKPLNFCSLTQNENSTAHILANKQLIKAGQYLMTFHHFYQLDDLTDYNIEYGCDIYYFDNVFSQLNIRANLATAISQNSISIGNGDTFLLQNGTLAFIEKANQLVLRTNQAQTQFRVNKTLSSILDVSE